MNHVLISRESDYNSDRIRMVKDLYSSPKHTYYLLITSNIRILYHNGILELIDPWVAYMRRISSEFLKRIIGKDGIGPIISQTHFAHMVLNKK